MRNKPFVTYGILGITSFVFALQFLFPSLRLESFLGMYSPYVVFNHEYWRFLTPMLIHFGFMHFALNGLVLYYMGQQCEAIFGHWRFAIIYILSGLMGNFGSFAFNGATALSGGASTAIFGLFGAFVVVGLHYRDNFAMQALTRQFGMFILLNLVFGLFDSTIDIWGHVGGLLGGGLLGLILAVPGAGDRFSTRGRITSVLFYFFFAALCILIGLRKLGLA